ncbi:DUF3310 domain-containing protein [Mesorhizobium sp. WSM4982]|uniref:DUF3310 domain-containing protein n=1 Tax=Mesorhizobium sp. WSM4982 TaxID=3038550 RepID=UPI0024158AE2|nr:DUF3310 domain-containing protein [Mesorhizobium sp. WSM4982]MDG4856419.1 DUF3310 domain-containing protein [Mesorhizobium sp. WSM4982]
MGSKKTSHLIGDFGSGVPGDGAPLHADDGDGRLLHGYSEEDWKKHGLHEDDLRKAQQTIRAAVDAGGLKEMSRAEKTEFLNRATAVSRKVATQADMVNLPNHYARFKIEPIRFIGDNKLDWFQGNIVKYVLRHDAKNGTEDIRKAIRYGQMYLLYLMGDPDWWKAGKPEDLKDVQ